MAHPNVKNQDWQSGLCSCGPINTCCMGIWCPCILVGRSADRMRDPTMQSAETCNSECMIFAAIQCVTGCGWIYGMLKRGEIRERFGIQGSGMNDCCASYWCSCCAIIQQEKETKARLTGGAPITQGYQPEKQGMTVPQAQPQPQQGFQPAYQPVPDHQQGFQQPPQAHYDPHQQPGHMHA